MRDAKQLARVRHVRAVQLRLAERDEADARDQLASQALLHRRVASLVAEVAPSPGASGSLSLAASAHYRARLHDSAVAAARRLAGAEQAAARAAARTREARRDETAATKLLERATDEETARALRALEATHPAGRARHDPC